MTSDTGQQRAGDVFRVEVLDPPKRQRIGRLLGTLTAGLLTYGAAPTSAGGRRVVISDARTGEELVTWPEPAGDDAHLLLGRIQTDLAALTADEFAERWIEGMTASA